MCHRYEPSKTVAIHVCVGSLYGVSLRLHVQSTSKVLHKNTSEYMYILCRTFDVVLICDLHASRNVTILPVPCDTRVH